MEEVERTCDRVAILKDGRLVDHEKVEYLKKTRQKAFVLTFAAEEEAVRFQEKWHGVCSRQGNRLTVNIQNELSELIAAMSRSRIVDLDVTSQSLEDFFLQFYGEEKQDAE